MSNVDNDEKSSSPDKAENVGADEDVDHIEHEEVNVDDVSASPSIDSDIEVESITGEVASIKSSSEDDESLYDNDVVDDDPEIMRDDSAEDVDDSLFGRCCTEKLDIKSNFLIEQTERSNSPIMNQNKNKLDDNAKTTPTLKKAKVDGSDINVPTSAESVNGHDPSSFVTPKRNLFPQRTGLSEKIALLQQQIEALQEAKSRQVKVSDTAGKLTNVVGGNVSDPVATQPSVSSDVTTTEVFDDFSNNQNAQLPVYKSPSSKNQQSGTVLTCEVSSSFTNITSGENVNAIILHGGTEMWFVKHDVLNESASHLLSAPLGGKIASVFTSWITTFYRKNPCGPNELHRRTLPYNQTSERPVYPSTKLMTIMSNPKSGFSVQTHVVYLQNQLRAMMMKSPVPAHFLNEHLKCEIPILYTKFKAGSYRRDGHKNTPYKDESELKKYFEEALKRTFKNEFRIVYDIPLDKYLPDSGIKNFLLSLGYNGFDEVREEERKNIYHSGNFPDWSKIEQEPLS